MNRHCLIIMRHGKSDWSAPGQADFDRPLAKKGVKAIPKMAAWLRDNGFLPDRILSSPALRARQTTERLAGELAVDTGAITRDERIYDAALDDLLEVVRDAGGAGCVLLVGHNPGLDALLEHLATALPPRNDEGKLLTTAAVAVLDYGNGDIRPDAGSGELLHLVRPGDLK